VKIYVDEDRAEKGRFPATLFPQLAGPARTGGGTQYLRARGLRVERRRQVQTTVGQAVSTVECAPAGLYRGLAAAASAADDPHQSGGKRWYGWRVPAAKIRHARIPGRVRATRNRTGPRWAVDGRTDGTMAPVPFLPFLPLRPQTRGLSVPLHLLGDFAAMEILQALPDDWPKGIRSRFLQTLRMRAARVRWVAGWALAAARRRAALPATSGNPSNTPLG